MRHLAERKARHGGSPLSKKNMRKAKKKAVFCSLEKFKRTLYTDYGEAVCSKSWSFQRQKKVTVAFCSL